MTAAQSTQPLFRSGVELVQVDVTVLDRNRRPVLGLNVSDFHVEVDGKGVSIDSFVPVVLSTPVNRGAAWQREIATDVSTNQMAEDGRLVVIVMDRSIPAGPPTITARQIAQAAIDQLDEHDLAAVVRTGGFVREDSVIGFTADKTRLRGAIDAPNTGWVNPPQMTPLGLRDSKPTLTDSGDCPFGLCVLEALTHVAESLAQAPRRQRVILFIGSAILIQEKPLEKSHGGLAATREETLRALDRANVTVHTIDPSGMETLAPGFGLGPGVRNRTSDNAQRQGDLAVLPSYTGGRTVVNTNTPVAFVAQIFDETRAYYLLAFKRDAHLDDKRHNITIRVDRRDVTVMSRQGYYSGNGAGVAPEPDPLKALVMPLVPRSDLPLDLLLTSGFQLSEEPEVDLLLRISGHATEDAAAARHSAPEPFDVLVSVFDREAREVNSSRHSVQASGESPTGTDWMAHFPLKPGRYEVRVGVIDKKSGRGGSVYGFVELPDLHRESIAVSDVRVERRLAEPAADQGWLPTLERTFERGDEVVASIQLHRSARNKSAVEVHVVTTDQHNVKVGDETNRFTGSVFNQAGLAKCRFVLPLSQLASGDYLTTIEVSDSQNRVRRDIRFRLK